MYDHDYNFFGGGGEEGIAAPSDDASVGNGGEAGMEGASSLAVASSSSSVGSGKHRDPFHVSSGSGT